MGGTITTHTVAIVDNDALVARLLKSMIEKDSEFTVMWIEQDGQAALDRIHRSVSGMQALPEILLTDISMHGINGIDMSEAIRFDHSDIIILGVTSYVPSLYYTAAHQAGMQGVVAKERVQELIEAMKQALDKGALKNGQRQFDTPAAAHERVIKRGRPFITLLSPAERETIEMSALGMSTEEMAEKTGVAPATIKTYLIRIAKKFGVRNKREAVAMWTKRVRH